MLVKKYKDEHGEDKELLVTIQKAVKSSPELRSKKELIEDFIEEVNEMDDVISEWNSYVAKQREADLETMIQDERLKPEETRKFLENSFKDGEIKTTGTDIEKILPPISRFGGGGARAKKKETVIDKLKEFFEKYFGIGGKVSFVNVEDDVCYQNIKEYKDAHKPSNEPPFTAIDVARHIVNYVNQNGGVISNLKLQKILYFIQGTYLSTAGKLCFPDLIHAWDFGPVIPEVYYEFKRFGSNSIPTIHTIYSSRHEAGLPKCWAYEDKIEGTEDAFVINTVINSIGQYSTTVLGDIIYDHGAWTKARETEDKIICWEDLKDSFDNFDKQKGGNVDAK